MQETFIGTLNVINYFAIQKLNSFCLRLQKWLTVEKEYEYNNLSTQKSDSFIVYLN